MRTRMMTMMMVVVVVVLCLLFVVGEGVSSSQSRRNGLRGPWRCEAGTKKRKVAVIGGGIGGASVAYFLSRLPCSCFETHIFEQHEALGGRLKHISWPGVEGPIELGGDAWASANHYVSGIVQDLGIPVELTARKAHGQRRHNARGEPWQQADSKHSSPVNVPPKLPEIAIWQGHRLFDIMKYLEHDLASDIVIAENTVDFLGRLNLNYLQRGDFEAGTPFHNISAFLAHGDLSPFTSTSSARFFGNKHRVSQTAEDFYLEPLVRTIYGQNMTAHAFATLVSLVSMTSAHSCTRGNSYLVEQMARNGTQHIHLAKRVTQIALDSSSHTFSVHVASSNSSGSNSSGSNSSGSNSSGSNSSGKSDDSNRDSTRLLHSDSRKKSSATSASTADVSSVLGGMDAVVVALPLEYLTASFHNINITHAFRPRKFVNCTVTIVEADGIQPSRFNAPANTTMPLQILTTANATSDGFTALQLVATTATKRSVYKLTTLGSVGQKELRRMLVNHTRVVQHRWQYTFPHLYPFSTSSHKSDSSSGSSSSDSHNNGGAEAGDGEWSREALHQPIEVAPNVFHLNAMESVASAMEGSVIAGRNIAQLLAQRFASTDEPAA